MIWSGRRKRFWKSERFQRIEISHLPKNCKHLSQENNENNKTCQLQECKIGNQKGWVINKLNKN